ncbi:hypothetical protein E6C60_3597 [Paenibacillus algicola]|uniref:Uncharacterized protein n=1 Tax=Paenibacillus algicola TaxID=2565926 RepID=A0A4P8XN62_9BACL|nr:hypothetical protein E6C60_3597 [Paenibacillus algicola]
MIRIVQGTLWRYKKYPYPEKSGGKGIYPQIDEGKKTFTDEYRQRSRLQRNAANKAGDTGGVTE